MRSLVRLQLAPQQCQASRIPRASSAIQTSPSEILDFTLKFGLKSGPYTVSGELKTGQRGITMTTLEEVLSALSWSTA